MFTCRQALSFPRFSLSQELVSRTLSFKALDSINHTLGVRHLVEVRNPSFVVGKRTVREVFYALAKALTSELGLEEASDMLYPAFRSTLETCVQLVRPPQTRELIPSAPKIVASSFLHSSFLPLLESQRADAFSCCSSERLPRSHSRLQLESLAAEHRLDIVWILVGMDGDVRFVKLIVGDATAVGRGSTLEIAKDAACASLLQSGVLPLESVVKPR